MQPSAGTYRLSTPNGAHWVIIVNGDGTAEVMGNLPCIWEDPPGHFRVEDMKVDIAFHGNDQDDTGDGTGVTNVGTPQEKTWDFEWKRLPV